MSFLFRYLNAHSISKRRIFEAWVIYRTKVERGNYWVSLFQTYIPLNYLILFIGAKLMIEKQPLWFIILGGISYSILMEIIKWVVGDKDMRSGIWKYETQYHQKNKVLSPFNVELMKNQKKQNKILSKILSLIDK